MTIDWTDLGHYRDATRYQEQAMKTANAMCGSREDFAVLALGLTGESGEVADIIKKYVGHGHDLDKEKLKKELGDVLWYVAVLSQQLGFTLGQVMQANVNKLSARYPNGFNTEDSKLKRDEVQNMPNPGALY
jgi:NTP pyrophosphatase (non-canonical NTP hydrolase)